MKLKKRTKKSLHIVLEKYILLSFIFCLMSFALPMYGNAENDFMKNSLQANEKNMLNMPEYTGKLDLSPMSRNDINALKYEDINEEEADKDETDKADNQKNVPNFQNNPEQEDIAQKNEQDKPISRTARKENSLSVQKNDNIMIVEGSRYPNTYENSVNSNTGFYMNITNPDGSGMNFGTYNNFNSNSNQERKKSRSQIMIDKIE